MRSEKQKTDKGGMSPLQGVPKLKRVGCGKKQKAKARSKKVTKIINLEAKGGGLCPLFPSPLDPPMHYAFACEQYILEIYRHEKILGIKKVCKTVNQIFM